MPGPLVVAMEDVLLFEDRKSYAASIPITEGVALARIWETVGSLICLTKSTQEAAEYWLRVNQIKFSAVVAPDAADAGQNPGTLQRRQIARLRATGPVWMVVTGDPTVGLWCFQRGQAATVFLQPSLRSSAPENEPRAWAELAMATHQARELRGAASVDQEEPQ